MYTPSQKLLKKYAEVLIGFALNSGKGIRKGEVVYLVTQLPGLPLAHEVYAEVLRRGGHPMVDIIDDNFKKINLQIGSDQQLLFFPETYYKGLSDTIHHWVRILADEDPMFLKSVDPKKIILAQRSNKPFRDWLDKKEDAGKFTWTLCLYGTEGMAKEAGIPLKDYWAQIEKACYLKDEDPVATWKTVFKDMHTILKKVNALPIDTLHVTAEQTDLTVKLGEKRRWLGGSGRNIPSFELFTSPDWRGTEGTIYFDLPLFRFGNIIEGIFLEFKNGVIVGAKAKKNEKLLKEMIAQKNADKIGEFSLTDKRFSKINKFMANTLYDENFGGKYGNMHLAVGKSYHDTYKGDPASMTKETFAELGYNDSVEHTDIIMSNNRKVEVKLTNGKTQLLYENGMFKI